MKKLLFSTLLFLFGTVSFAAGSLPSPQAEKLIPIDKIVAVVNKDIITEAELEQAMAAAKKQIQQRGMPMPSSKELRSKVLDGLIYQKLQLQMAQQNNITITPKQIDEAIENIANQNHVSVDQLKQKIAADHVDLTTFRKQIKDQLIVSTLQHEALSGKIDLTQAKVNAFKKQYQNENSVVEYHVMDYLIPLNEDATATQKQDAEQRALKISKQLRSSNSVSDNGVLTNDLGWRAATDLPDILAGVVVKMADNSASQPILAGNGYHVLKLLATKQKDSDISDQQAREYLIQQESQKLLKKWLEAVRSNSYVKIYD